VKFLLDESADRPLAAFLRAQGHDVTVIALDYPNAIKDTEALAIARQEQRILITNDRDFGELVFRQQLPHAGVILFRLNDEAVRTKAALLQYVLSTYPEQLSNFVVITERRIRIRHAPDREA